MARFGYQDVDRYGGQGGAGFFSLKNDKDTAQIRFLYKTIEDVEGYAVHQVELDGKRRYVNCIREYSDPKDVCPLCASGEHPQLAKMFIPVYNLDQGRVQIWERGKKFFSKMSSLCARYKDLSSWIFEVERNGKPKESSTTYEIYPVEEVNDDEELPELDQPILGGVVLDKTAEDMEYFLQEGDFPPADDGDEEDDQPVRRRSSRCHNEEDNDEDEKPRSRSQQRRQSEQRESRRTPARGRDAF